MLKPKNKTMQLSHAKHSLPLQFSLLVWNIHKENQTKRFQQQFHTLMHKYKSDLLLFQEVKYPKKGDFFFQNYSFAMAGNIETKRDLFGVLTATKSSFSDILHRLSTKKELGFVSHKSFLLSKHLVQDGRYIHILNLHAINFVSTKTFAYELDKIEEDLTSFEGPLIVGGDFNNWNTKRMKFLKRFQTNLQLTKLEIQNEHHIKRIFSQTIDHIYYRDLKALKAVAIDTQNISDHNPIYAMFELES